VNGRRTGGTLGATGAATGRAGMTLTPEEASMRYLLLICSDKAQTAPPPADMNAIVQAHMRLSDELRAAGKMVVSERLRPDSDGTRVRTKAGQRQLMDGPFTETKEALGGFYLIECDTKQEAVEWAKKIPLGDGGFVEVRPIWPM
jgi:hypothetical protein